LKPIYSGSDGLAPLWPGAPTEVDFTWGWPERFIRPSTSATYGSVSRFSLLPDPAMTAAATTLT
jgi:hypothetical protein